MNEHHGIWSLPLEPREKWAGLDLVEPQNWESLVEAEPVFAPTEIGRRMGMGTAQFLVLAEDEPEAAVSEAVQPVQRLHGIVVGMAYNPVQMGLNAQP
jgi:hypothetical protein